MSRTFRNLILLLAVVLGLGGSAFAADTSITISGAETQPSGVWDTGGITIAFGDSAGHSYSETVTYGQYSTPASIASAFGAKFSNDYFPSGLLCAHAVGSVISFHLKGAASFGLPSITNPSVSFSFARTAWQAMPVIAWATPGAITYGTALSTTQLNATAWTPSPSGALITLAGTFAYSETSGTVLTAGTQTLSATFTPSDTIDFSTAMATVPLTVNKATPTINWATPTAINFRTALSAAQLNATASVPGSFVYSPPAGTIPSGGSQILSVTFTPSDTTDYNTITASVVLTVNEVSMWTNHIVAGNGGRGCSGDGTLATSAMLAGPLGLAVDNIGNIYIVDFYCDRIREVSASTGIITTIAGTGVFGYSGDGGAATNAELYYPYDVKVDGSNNVYISDSLNYRVRKINASTGIITTIAGNGKFGFNGDNGLATNAELNAPTGLAIDGSNNIYFIDGNNNRIREVNALTGIITTVAGNGSAGFSGDGGLATNAMLKYPYNLAADNAGNLFIADVGNNRIRKVTSSTGVITTVAGTGVTGYSGDGGAATNAELDYPYDVKVDGAGDLYIADTGNLVVRMVKQSNGFISSIATVDPFDIFVNPAGNILYVSSNPVTSQVVVRYTYGPNLIDWPTPAPIAFGTPLNSVQLDAASDVQGTFAYSPSSGTVLSPGSHTLSVVFTPTDTADYQTLTSTVNLTVDVPQTTLLWANPEGIAYGTPLSSAQLNATSNVPGTFVYNPPSGTMLNVGSYSLTATFTPTDTTDYRSATATVPLTVNQAIPTITWAVPAPITYGTAVSAAQLDAASSVSGTFTYDMQSGTVLDVGSYLLAVTFTPTDITHYTTASASVTLQVNFVTAPTNFLYSYSIANSSGVPGSGYAGNGDIQAYTDSVNGTWSNLSYDGLDRLVGGIETPPGGTTQYACWSYDNFGNRTAQILQTSSCPTTLTPTVSYNANNQVTWVQNSAPVGFTYDGAGNVTCDGAMSNGACQGTHAYLYDAEGRICAEKTEPIPGTYTMTQYIYNASGARVAKGSITNWAVGCDTTQNGFTLTNSYVLGPHNEQLTEMDGNGNWQHTNVYATGELVATIKQDAVHFHLSDLLGNRRVQSTYNGAVELSCSGLPFGDQQNCSGSGVDAAEHHFTGKERDTESGNDYFGARYYSSSMGRFMSPDEVFADQHPGDPQSWNLYGYGRNNPLKFVDPTGESIYAIFYTVGNDKNDHSDDGGDATFKKAAETMANDIQHEKGFDPKNDVVLTFGVNSKQDFIDALSSIKGLEAYFGKVAQLDLYSHSGNDGPVFPGQLGASRLDRQFMLPGKHGGIDISQLRALDIDWESNAYAAFYGCHTRPFADAFGQAQGVNTFGYKGFSSFFATEGGWLGEYPFSRANTKPGYRGPIYPGSKHILFGDYNDLHQKWLIF